jgi:general secretion pathway protein N
MKAGAWRWPALGLLACVFYLLFLLAFAPAAYFGRAVAWLSHGAVTIDQTQGSLWSGSGRCQFLQAPALGHGQIDWSLRFWPLLLGRGVVRVHYSSTEADVSATISASTRRFAVENLAASAPAQIAPLFYPPAAFLGLTGRLRASAASFALSTDEIRGAAELRWDAAASQLLPVSPAGDYRAQIDADGKFARVRITTEQGSINVQGDGEWRPFEDGSLRLQGTVASATAHPLLETMLNTVGPMQPDGRRPFNYQIRVPLGAIPVLAR